MLSQRKKYNYMINAGTAPTPRSRQPSSASSSAYKPALGSLYQNENINIDGGDDYQSVESKRIVELENANKRMLEETTKQFQKFEVDVVKVEGILRLKEQHVDRLEAEKRELTEDKAALIDALREKEAIIQQFHQKLKELIEQRESRKKQVTVSGTQTHLPVPTLQSECQTQPVEAAPSQQPQLQKQLQWYQQKYQSQLHKSQLLTQQVYKLKQQVYQSNSELGLLKQQFETYKLLEEIEEVRKL